MCLRRGGRRRAFSFRLIFRLAAKIFRRHFLRVDVCDLNVWKASDCAIVHLSLSGCVCWLQIRCVSLVHDVVVMSPRWSAANVFCIFQMNVCNSPAVDKMLVSSLDCWLHMLRNISARGFGFTLECSWSGCSQAFKCAALLVPGRPGGDVCFFSDGLHI